MVASAGYPNTWMVVFPRDGGVKGGKAGVACSRAFGLHPKRDAE